MSRTISITFESRAEPNPIIFIDGKPSDLKQAKKLIRYFSHKLELDKNVNDEYSKYYGGMNEMKQYPELDEEMKNL